MTARQAENGRSVLLGHEGQSISFTVSGYAHEFSGLTNRPDWDANWLNMSYRIDWSGQTWERTVESELTWHLSGLATFFELVLEGEAQCEWSDNEVALSLIHDPSFAPHSLRAELWPQLQHGSVQGVDGQAVVMLLSTSVTQIGECVEAAKAMCELWPVRGVRPSRDWTDRPRFRS